MIRMVVQNAGCFQGVIEFEKNSLSPLSKRLFTFSAIYTATKELLKDIERSSLEQSSKMVIDFWEQVAKQLPEWSRVQKNDLLASEVRTDYVHTHGIFLTSIARVGNYLLNHKKVSWKKILEKIKNIDWRRSNPDWEGRCMIGGGRISKARINVVLTANYIKKKLSLTLDPQEENEERQFKERKI